MGSAIERKGPVDLTGVFSAMLKTGADMDTYLSIEILDHLQAFYPVFHDDIYHLSLTNIKAIGSNEELY